MSLESTSGFGNAYMNISNQLRRDGVAVPAAQAATGGM
jgi:hypothetical protein